MGLGDSGRGKLQCVPFITLKRLLDHSVQIRSSLQVLDPRGAGRGGEHIQGSQEAQAFDRRQDVDPATGLEAARRCQEPEPARPRSGAAQRRQPGDERRVQDGATNGCQYGRRNQRLVVFWQEVCRGGHHCHRARRACTFSCAICAMPASELASHCALGSVRAPTVLTCPSSYGFLHALLSTGREYVDALLLARLFLCTNTQVVVVDDEDRENEGDLIMAVRYYCAVPAPYETWLVCFVYMYACIHMQHTRTAHTHTHTHTQGRLGQDLYVCMQ